ncbi:MAG: hypothetical protein N3B16_07995, partial [Candidatus Aminicenantes bacterium]|nr:hypothetical protein [Candidatus Aminicenantes bacterium]
LYPSTNWIIDLDGMETSKRRDCDYYQNSRTRTPPPLDGMETSKRRDCDWEVSNDPIFGIAW